MTPIASKLQESIEHLHQCKARHLGSESVKEVFKGQTVWEGRVEVFALMGHPKAKKCYAWAHNNDLSQTRYISVLEIPPVTSAQTAVKAAIASGQQG